MLKDRMYQISMVLAIVMGVAGVPILTQVACNEMYVQDPVTGEVRLATPEEEIKVQAAVVAQTVATAETLAVATGHPEYVPLIGLAGQLALALTALFINRKRNGLPQMAPKVDRPPAAPQV